MEILRMKKKKRIHRKSPEASVKFVLHQIFRHKKKKCSEVPNAGGNTPVVKHIINTSLCNLSKAQGGMDSFIYFFFTL